MSKEELIAAVKHNIDTFGSVSEYVTLMELAEEILTPEELDELDKYLDDCSTKPWFFDMEGTC